MPTIMESKQFWEQQLERLKASGLPRSDYCRKNNINYDRFGYWLKRLLPKPSAFVPVKLKIPAATPQTILCTIELRSHILKIYDLSTLSFVLERLA